MTCSATDPVRAATSRCLRWLLCFCAALSGFSAAADPVCGSVVKLAAHDRSSLHYAHAPPAEGLASRAVLVLLAGGGGHLDLDAEGCARKLTGNSLVRSQALFQEAGFVTVLVDAPSDHTGTDGLGGFRIAPEHAADLGKVIADVRQRFDAPVWLVGTSRGAISAANAASRLSGVSAPDGVVLTSALMEGAIMNKEWVAHSVFDLPLEAITMPLLVIGHAEDSCSRSPPERMASITARSGALREQVVLMTGGTGKRGLPSVEACAGRTPHGFVGQEAEMVGHIQRFIAGEAPTATP